MFVNITEKPPWGSVIKAITITITAASSGKYVECSILAKFLVCSL